MRSNKILFALILLGCVSIQTLAQNQSPQVSNVIFSQRLDGSFMVDVYYDVNDPDGNSMTVTMKVSSDNGATWNFSCNNLAGDVSAGITNGTAKHIVWNFGSEHSQTFGDQFRVKITVDDGSIVMGIPCPGTPTVLYQGKTYNTVQIGSQCWLKENLDVGTRVNGSVNQTNNGIIEKYCYNDDPANCTTYGGLYQWNESMQYVTTPGTKGICPTGFHIPTYAELQTLQTIVSNDANSLKAFGQGTGSGVGTNTSGFSALLAGYRNVNNGTFYSLEIHTFFLSSTEYGTNAFTMELYYNDSPVGFGYFYKGNGFSVRCAKD